MSNYYDVIGCDMNSSLEELKHAYHEKALQCHPDKSDNEQDQEKFQELQEAWRMLRDPAKRRAYDKYVRQTILGEQHMLFGTFKLKDLTYDEETQEYSLPCKCGGIYKVLREGSEGFNSFLVNCEYCSLMISVNVK